MRITRSWRAKGLLALTATAVAVAFATPSAAIAEGTPSEAATPPSSEQIVSLDAEPRELTAQEQADIDAISAASDTTAETFDADAARSAGASDAAVDAAASLTNEAGWTVTGSYTMNSEARTLGAVAQACTGASGYTGYWVPWGHQFAMNSCHTDQLISGVGLGAAGAGAISALLAVLKAPPQVIAAGGLITAIITLGAAAFQACKSFSPKSAIYLNVGGQPVVSCWGQ